jgi:hypothetical protein
MRLKIAILAKFQRGTPFVIDDDVVATPFTTFSSVGIDG